MFKYFMITILIFVLTIGFLTIFSNNITADIEAVFCCNNFFPGATENPNSDAQMHCDGDPYTISKNTCLDIGQLI